MKYTSNRFVGYALTAVHIGDGTTMTPDGYRIRSGSPPTLERFDPPAVIAAMLPALRAQYIRALSQGGVKQAQEILGKAADGAIRERIAISRHSLSQIEQVMRNPLRRGHIGPFIRSGGVPIVPGSSVKGALRTAWFASETRLIPPDEIRDFARRVEKVKPGKTGGQSDEVQQVAFDCERGRTEQDPLRDVSVSDASLEAESTVIDRVQVANCTKEGPIGIGPEGAMQIHVERLASIADAGVFPAKPFKITIAAPDTSALAERREFSGTRAKGGIEPRAVPTHSPRIDELRRAANAHHTALWFYEKHRFYRGTRTDALLDELISSFGFPAQREKLEAALDSAGAWLVKVGRYCHFESKSIELQGKRYGEKRGRKGRHGAPDIPARFMSEGGSRTVAQDSGGRFLPFGWVLLLPEASAPKELPRIRPAPVAEAGRSAAQGPRTSATPAAIGQYLFLKDERVTNGDETVTVLHNVRPGDKQMQVRTADGDSEPVPVQGWERLT